MSGRNKLTVVPLDIGPQMAGDEIAERRAALVAAIEAGELPTAQKIAGWMDVANHAGRVQAALVAATVSERIIAESYQAIVESKAYIGVPHIDADGSWKHVSSLDEFCEVFFGKGARRCRQMAANLDTLGADLYEAGERIGLGQRDYNALRALPADDQAVVKAALAEGSDKSAVLDLLNELAKRLQEAQADKETLDRRSRDQIAHNQELRESLSDARHFLRSAPPMEQAREMLVDLAVRFMDSRVSISRTEEALLTFFAYTNEHDLDFDADIDTRVTELFSAVLAIASEIKVTRGIDGPLRRAAVVLAMHPDLSTGA